MHTTLSHKFHHRSLSIHTNKRNFANGPNISQKFTPILNSTPFYTLPAYRNIDFNLKKYEGLICKILKSLAGNDKKKKKTICDDPISVSMMVKYIILYLLSMEKEIFYYKIDTF